MNKNQDASVTQPSESTVPVNGRILVAEDDPIGQFVVKRILDQAGYVSDLVSDGKQVIDALASKNYDLVLMDCLMPQMDGFAATRLIRGSTSEALNSEIPIIALTGLTAHDDRSKCLDAGMNSMISKPVDSGILIAAIKQCLGGTSLENEVPENPVWDDGFLNTIIDKFLAEVPQVIEDLNVAIARQDPVKLESIGHRLRGASDILEATTLSALSRALEQVGKAGNIKVASKLASELIKELNKFVAVLTE
jgi:CheY-like chemotaxis protein/HPt (histidine-containing phosphotransfer) domain-containing protein